MPSVETIYQESVKQLPLSDRVRLAEIIMEHVVDESASVNGRLSAADLLDEVQDDQLFKNASEVDEHLKAERDSWEN